MSALGSLAFANAAFVASHFALSHPLRAPLVRRLGEKPFLAVYSGISLVLFAWIFVSFWLSPNYPVGSWAGAEWAWGLASGLTLMAMALLLGSFLGNPAFPETQPAKVREAKPVGAFAVTRHPMLWGFAFWAMAHVLAWPSARTLLTAGAMGFLALVGARLQDRKKEALLGQAWAGWEARTSFVPRLTALHKIGWLTWLIAALVWLFVTAMHIMLAGQPAGIWRWVF